jgi:hypothetical protein
MRALDWLLLSALPVSNPAAGDLSPASPAAVAPAVRLWMNSSQRYREGDRARVQVEARDDGYLLVLNYDTDGRLRILFPIDPREDNFVRGGRRYEVRGRGDRESFIAGRDGDGLVYAAVSPDPFRLDEFEAGGNWDYTRLSISDRAADPEADITDLIRGVSSDRGFDYDLLEYHVYGYRDYRVAGGWYPRPLGYYDDYYCDWWYRPSLFGCRSWWPGSFWYSGWGFGLGFYSPYRYGYYNPYRYGYYPYGYYNPWYRDRYYYPSTTWPVVVGRPRGYTIVRRGSGEGRNPSGVVGGGTVGGSRPADLGGRPRGSDGRGRPSSDRPSPDRPAAGSAGTRGSNPPATPSRPRPRPPGEDQADGRVAREGGLNIERDRGESARGPVEIGDRPRAGGSDRPAVTPDASRPSIEVMPERPRSEDARRVDVPDRSPRVIEVSPERPRTAETRRVVVEVPARRSEPASREVSRPSAPRSEPRYEPRSEPRYEPRSDGPRPRAEAPARREGPSSPPPRIDAPRSAPPRSAPPPSSSGPRSSARPRPPR